MGGVDHVLETENIVLQGSGRQYRLGQNQNPDDELPYWEVEDYVRKIDPHTPRWNLTNRRTSTFLTGNPAFGQEQNFGLDGDVAYSFSAICSSTGDSPDWPDSYLDHWGNGLSIWLR